MNTECDICYNTTIIIPCGANNNCKAMVCKDCFWKCDNDCDFTCVFCKCVDERKTISGYVDYICNDTGGDDYSSKSYVELKMWILKNKDLISDFCEYDWDSIGYCLECED